MSDEAMATREPPSQVEGMPNLPADWEEVTLGDIITLEYGRSLPDKVRRAGAVPVYGSNGVVGAHDEPLVLTGGIIVGRKGTAGSVTVSPGPFWPIDTTYFVKARKVVDWDWLATTLHHARLNELNEATGVPGLNRDKAYGQSVLLPPLDEQRRIAEVLRSVDEAFAAQSILCSHLRQTASDLADDLYAHELDACGSELVAYGDACETVQVGIVVKPASYYVDGDGVPALRSTNIKRNEIDISALVQLSREGHAINKKSALRAGDVVTIRTGEPGKTAVIPQNAPSPLNCIDIIFSRPKPELRPCFASYFINSGAARMQIGAMQGGLAQQHFNVGEMKKLKLPVPTLVRQDRVIAVLDAAWQAVRVEEAQLVTLQSTKRALMADLLSGRVRVPA